METVNCLATHSIPLYYQEHVGLEIAVRGSSRGDRFVKVCCPPPMGKVKSETNRYEMQASVN